MKKYRKILWVFAAIGAGTAGWTKVRANANGEGVAVSGAVTVVEPGKQNGETDASGVVVWLTPLEKMEPVRVITEKPRYRLVQRNKRFDPPLLVVPVGSVVDFPNADPWFHNVFSLYRGKRFDLGLYQAGAERSVRFDRPGPSYLFCNIHPEMSGVVLAVNSEFFGVSDRKGSYVITGVSAGRYLMNVWYEKAAAESLPGLQRTVTIDDSSRVLPTITVVAVRRPSREHKNKYGEDYDPEGIKSEY